MPDQLMVDNSPEESCYKKKKTPAIQNNKKFHQIHQPYFTDS